jgi:hypothetical protein
MRTDPASKSKLRYPELTGLFRNFRPSTVVGVRDSPELDSNNWLKTVMLAQLLAWMILDQPRKKSKRTGKVIIRKTNANQIGLVVVGAMIDLRFRNAKFASTLDDKSFVKLVRLFWMCKGYAALQNRGGRAILSRMKRERTDRELQCVLRIIDYMCRFADQHSERDSNFTIESAKKFVEKFYDEDQMGPSKISKIWEKYKYASPYIFGASDLLDQLKTISTIDDFVIALRQLTDSNMKFIISRAAYAADILGHKARNIPKSHFKDVERAVPRLPPFTPEELTVIRSIDRNAPTR